MVVNTSASLKVVDVVVVVPDDFAAFLAVVFSVCCLVADADAAASTDDFNDFAVE